MVKWLKPIQNMDLVRNHHPDTSLSPSWRCTSYFST